MSITSEIASRIWRQKAQMGSLRAVHEAFEKWGAQCTYETFRTFANESNQGSGTLINQLDKFLTEKETE